jgi:predicted RNA-binding Zn ribbon-like protein
VEPSTVTSAEVEFSQVGGHPAIDLVNTVDWRLDPHRRGERLASMGRVLEWCLVTGLLSTAEHDRLVEEVQQRPRVAERQLGEVIHWRETLYRALMTTSLDAADRLAAGFRSSLQRARLQPAGNQWAWQDVDLSLSTPIDRIARITVDLMTDPRLAYLHQCEDEACGWIYLDTSPRRNRRWCTAADCGNRNRARRFYQRRHDGPAADAAP